MDPDDGETTVSNSIRNYPQMSSIRKILARKDEIRVELRSLAAGCDAGNADALARFNVLAAEVDSLNDAERRAAVLADLEQRATGVLLAQPDTGFQNLLDGFSLTRALAASAGLDNGAAGREREVSAELFRRSGRPVDGFMIPVDVLKHSAVERRAILAAGSGAPLIQTDVGPIVDRLRNASILSRAGATFLSGLRDSLSLPALTASVTANWVADGATIPSTDPTLSPIALAPKTIGALSEYSRSMLVQTSPDVDNLLRSDMALQVASALDLAALTGSGVAPVPTGLVNVAGVNQVPIGTNGGLLTYAAVLALMAAVNEANGPSAGAMSFVTNSKVVAAGRGLVDTQGRPLGFATVFQGLPVLESNTVVSTGTKGTGTGLSSLYYGAWSNLLVAQFGDLLINSNANGSAYERGGVQVRILASYDIAPRNPAAFGFTPDIAA